jgi:hypothetical protein
MAALGDELEIQLRRLESDDESVDGEVNESESNSISDTHQLLFTQVLERSMARKPS